MHSASFADTPFLPSGLPIHQIGILSATEREALAQRLQAIHASDRARRRPVGAGDPIHKFCADRGRLRSGSCDPNPVVSSATGYHWYVVTSNTASTPSMNSIPCLLLSAALALILQGCAGTPVEPPKIERISAEQLEARLPQPAAILPLEQIELLARQGASAEDLIARITASNSRYRLSAAQIVELAQQGVPLAVLDHLVAAERRRIFDDMAADANQREKLCHERIEQEVRWCRNQMIGPMYMPGPYPMINCFPLTPGSPFWRCL